MISISQGFIDETCFTTTTHIEPRTGWWVSGGSMLVVRTVEAEALVAECFPKIAESITNVQWSALVDPIQHCLSPANDVFLIQSPTSTFVMDYKGCGKPIEFRVSGQPLAVTSLVVIESADKVYKLLSLYPTEVILQIVDSDGSQRLSRPLPSSVTLQPGLRVLPALLDTNSPGWLVWQPCEGSVSLVNSAGYLYSRVLYPVNPLVTRAGRELLHPYCRESSPDVSLKPDQWVLPRVSVQTEECAVAFMMFYIVDVAEALLCAAFTLSLATGDLNIELHRVPLRAVCGSVIHSHGAAVTLLGVTKDGPSLVSTLMVIKDECSSLSRLLVCQHQGVKDQWLEVKLKNSPTDSPILVETLTSTSAWDSQEAEDIGSPVHLSDFGTFAPESEKDEDEISTTKSSNENLEIIQDADGEWNIVENIPSSDSGPMSEDGMSPCTITFNRPDPVLSQMFTMAEVLQDPRLATDAMPLDGEKVPDDEGSDSPSSNADAGELAVAMLSHHMNLLSLDNDNSKRVDRPKRRRGAAKKARFMLQHFFWGQQS
eukprot:Blabericola_migrator_1__1771@NODE_147_length_12949_cov_102_817264_g128_i0_p4_GENE_NODE_147_length_12949_cov_102_817264_g128_i0NODE_147_length_12949_cov_102_817264_g128_i0_p4_ORF_typecomplete_len541_score56_02_NODE_147_length_12949_cov_102_817264_g128_i079349556